MAISASMVKELRETTGAGMLDCKKALEATDGNIESAIDWLREKGISKAAKKSTRIAAEGLAETKTDNNKAVIVEINSETDFVAKNEEFKKLVETVTDTILKSNATTLEEALKLTVDGKDLEQLIAEKSGTIGEKITLRRFEIVEKNDDQVFGTYSHQGGRIVTLTVLDGNDLELAKDIAMQAAAMRPLYLTRDEVPEEKIEKEKAILMEQAENEGLDSKYLYVCHAEFNAILNTKNNTNLKGCTIYVTLFPCNECAKAIIQVGISKVIYLEDKYHDSTETKASRLLFDLAGVKYEPYVGRYKEVIVK